MSLKESVQHANQCIVPYLTMMFKGTKINVEKYLQRFDDLELKREQIGRMLKVITNKNINPRSPKQVCKYLYDELGFEMPDKEPTNKKSLYKLLTKNNIPSVRCIISYKVEGKLASSLKYRLWANNIWIKKDALADEDYNRFTTAYTLAGTDTFRRGSRALLRFRPDKGFGSNYQNWNKKMRDLIVADEGYLLGQNDQSGAEALIVAYLCRMGRFRQLFLHKIKPHVFVGMHLFRDVWERTLGGSIEKFIVSDIDKLKLIDGWSELDNIIKDSDNWPSDQRYYYIAKQTCHSANYSIRGPTFQMNTLVKSEGSVVLSVKQCNNFLGMYHDLFPEIRQWHCEIQDEVKSTRTLNNLFNFPRKFHEPTGEELFKQAYAFKPQSTVACITSRAIVNLQRRIEERDSLLGEGFDILQDGHDSILWQSSKEKVKECAAEVKKELEQELTSPRGEIFKMGSECSIGENWGPKSAKYNLLGLEEVKI